MYYGIQILEVCFSFLCNHTVNGRKWSLTCNKVVGNLMESLVIEEGLTEINTITWVNSKLMWPSFSFLCWSELYEVFLYNTKRDVFKKKGRREKKKKKGGSSCGKHFQGQFTEWPDFHGNRITSSVRREQMAAVQQAAYVAMSTGHSYRWRVGRRSPLKHNLTFPPHLKLYCYESQREIILHQWMAVQKSL